MQSCPELGIAHDGLMIRQFVMLLPLPNSVVSFLNVFDHFKNVFEIFAWSWVGVEDGANMGSVFNRQSGIVGVFSRNFEGGTFVKSSRSFLQDCYIV